MALPRDLVVAALRAVAPADSFQVEPYARGLDNVHKATAMVRMDNVKPNPEAQGLRDYQGGVLVVGPKTAPGVADDELDAALEDVLHAIEQSPGLHWTEAKRATLDETWPAYEITLTVTTTKE